MDFGSMNLSANMMRGVVAMGYENPSAIQKQAIPALLQGKDMLGQASSGCSKTAAFVLPLLHTLPTAGTTLQHRVNG
jgi:superfamily II DNA/RNA helicase